MLRKPVPFYNQKYNQQSQGSIDQSSSAKNSYKKKLNYGCEDERNNNLQERQEFENNPTRRGEFNSNERYLVNETKVKRPAITNSNNPYTIGGNSYKLERLSPYGTGQRNAFSQNTNNINSAKIPSQSINNKMSQELGQSIKLQHLVSFGNITNLNPSTQNNKNNNFYNLCAQKSVDKQNYEPNSEESHIYDHRINENGYNKNNITKASTNPSVKEHVLTKKQNQNEYLLPIVNTNTGNHSRQSSNSQIHNFHSNVLLDASSIASENEQKISQADESAYLKQKLIQTHSKLIKQLEISKELQDNFFELKNKYQQVVSLLNQQKSRPSDQISQTQIRQLQLKQNSLNSQNLILTQKLQQLVEENKCLKSELAQMSQNLTQLILDNQSQKKKPHMLNYFTNDLKQSINLEKAQSNQQLSQYNHQKAQYQQEINKQANIIQQLKNDLENMRNKLLQMIKEKQSKEQKIQSFNQEKHFLQDQLKVLQVKLCTKEKQFAEKQELCEIWRKKYSDAQQQQQKVYESNIKLQKQAKQLKNINQQLNIALRQQKQKNAQMLSQIINIQMQTKQLKSKVSCLQEERKSLQDKLFQNSQQKNILQQKLQLEHNIQKLTHQYNSLSAIINKKDKQINDLSNQVFQKNNIVLKMSLKEKELEIKERQLQKRERDLHDHKISRIASVKEFVNKLEEDKSVIIRKTSNNNTANFNNHAQRQFTNNMYNQVNYKQQNIIKQNVLNVSSSMRLESGNTTPTRHFSPLSHTKHTKTLKHIAHQNQLTQQNQFTNNQNFINEPNNKQRSLTPIKSSSGLKLNCIDTNKCCGTNIQNYHQDHQNNNNILICQNGQEQNQYQYQEEYADQNYADEGEQNFCDQETHGNRIAQYESVEDSLQLVRMINKISSPQDNPKNPIHNHNANRVNSQGQNVDEDNTNYQYNPKTMLTQKSAQQLHTNKQINAPCSQSKRMNAAKKSSNTMTQQKQKQISSYKQQKQQYLSLVQQIGQLETQNYNLNQEKKKIVEQLEKIQSTKTKTKEMIARRRQLELWLLGNQKKNHQVKDKLKIYRGKVL